MDTAMSARRPTGTTRSPKTYAHDRICADPGCTTRLSRYNKREFCHPHAPVRYPRIRGQFEDDRAG